MIIKVGSPEWLMARYNAATGGINLDRVRREIVEKAPKPEDAVQVSISFEAKQLHAALEACNNLTNRYERD
jgi:hypothetical protein